MKDPIRASRVQNNIDKIGTVKGRYRRIHPPKVPEDMPDVSANLWDRVGHVQHNRVRETDGDEDVADEDEDVVLSNLVQKPLGDSSLRESGYRTINTRYSEKSHDELECVGCKIDLEVCVCSIVEIQEQREGCYEYGPVERHYLESSPFVLGQQELQYKTGDAESCDYAYPCSRAKLKPLEVGLH